MPTRINLWSSPRNVSTALMYSFAQRPDTRVVDEPLYAHYLKHSPRPVIHPGQEAILASQLQDGAQVVRQQLLGPVEQPVVVFKQMTHHLIALDRSFLLEMKNVLLIRHPRRIIASYAKVIPEPVMEDVGIQMQYELAQYLKVHGRLDAVLDSKDLLLDPKQQLEQLCEKLDIPFYEKMLSWPAGPRPEDGVWAPHWYANVHQSTGFAPYQEREVALNPQQEALANACQPFYEALIEM